MVDRTLRNRNRSLPITDDASSATGESLCPHSYEVCIRLNVVKRRGVCAGWQSRECESVTAFLSRPFGQGPGTPPRAVLWINLIDRSMPPTGVYDDDDVGSVIFHSRASPMTFKYCMAVICTLYNLLPGRRITDIQQC